ncbi:DegV family protein [Floccifex sp.]|uniref:DegV family protein n=1 Tax=Floccifex sp. TaxID=2815810 RepID=UPI002A74BF64|nr:DegV family protein [Floccifex sp.]MDY2958021.1 DegV family protein [Floccifex sp.]
MKIKVITDSGSCLNEQQAKENNIEFLPLQVSIDEHVFLDGINLTTEELYDYLDKGYMPQTSMPPLGMIEEMFDRFQKEEVTDVVLITLSNGLSSTNTTIQASAKWHNIKVHTLDIYTTLAVENYLALSASKLVSQNVQVDEIIRRLQEAVNHSKGFLMPENLDHLARGGRLSPAAAKLAGLLKIVPILEVSKDTEGKVGGKSDKVRTMTKAIKKVVDSVCKEANPEDYEVFVLDSRASEQAQTAQDLFEKEGYIVHRMDIGAVIAAHTGNRAVGIQFVKKVKGG